MEEKRVAILGASDNSERYSYKAFKMLQQHGHEPILVSPRHTSIDGHPVYPDLKSLKDIDTLTMYVNPNLAYSMREDIYKLAPKRVIFNPGSESPELMDELRKKGIEVEPACTLVLLSTGQF